MKRLLLSLIFLCFTTISFSQQRETFDYWKTDRDIIQKGVQAILMCNGLFTSERTLEQVFDQELAYLRNPIGTATEGNYKVDWELKTVAIGTGQDDITIRAAYRKGVGCVIMAPNQTFAEINELPELDLPPLKGDASKISWPNGNLIKKTKLPKYIDSKALNDASEWAFERDSEEQVTLSLLVVHKGKIILERYAEGVDMTTKTRTWSTAKSIAATLVGIAVEDDLLKLDESLGIEWLPSNTNPANDPRNEITLRHVLNMSSGLYTVDNNRMEYATGSGLSYWAGASAVNGARSRGLIRKPGTTWDYENYDAILAVYALKLALGDTKTYIEYPHKELLDKIGMRNTILSVDRFGDFILSSQVYTNARDLARFGMLYQQNGLWDGEQIITKEWIDFVTSPAPSTANSGNFYGGQWWLVPDNRTDVPKDAYSTAGNRGQFTIVVPSHDLVIVRRGLDYGKQGFNRWDLTREVLKAFEEFEIDKK